MRGRGAALLIGMKAGERRAEAAQAQQQQAQQPAAPAPAPAAPPPSGGDMSAQLQNLTNMHNAGQLTDEEYAAAKKKLLG